MDTKISVTFTEIYEKEIEIFYEEWIVGINFQIIYDLNR